MKLINFVLIMVLILVLISVLILVFDCSYMNTLTQFKKLRRLVFGDELPAVASSGFFGFGAFTDSFCSC